MQGHKSTMTFVTFLAIAALMSLASAQDDMAGIKTCLNDSIAAFNARDNKAIQDLHAYPQVYSPPSGPLAIMRTPADFVTDFEQLIREKGWARTDIDSFDVVHRSPAKAHVSVAFSSYNAGGERYQSSSALWILARKDDRWAVHLRSFLGPNESAVQDPIDETKGFLDAFFEAFNRRDDAALHEMTIYPHAFSFHDGQLILAQDATEMTIDFDKLAEEDGWRRSTLDSYKVVQHSSNKVHVLVEFSRHNKAGERYDTNQVLYVLVKSNGRWGLQMRSLFSQVAAPLIEGSE